MTNRIPYKDWIVRYYASHDDIPPGHTDGELTELIRCKDCKWFDPCEWSSKYGKCHAMKHGYKSNGWDIGIYRMTNSNDFCSSAEREEIE